MRKHAIGAAAALAACAAFRCTAATPYTHQNFLDDPEEFRFAVIPDRTGGDHRGAWTNAFAKVNLLRPTFVMTVGDLIPWGWLDEAAVEPQYAELKAQIAGVVPPFYAVVGNHDIANDGSRRVWKRYFGDTYYSFVYKNTLFIALDIMLREPYSIGKTQYAWAEKTLKENPDVRWTFIFMHAPSTWRTEAWQAFEKNALAGRRYTVFAGDEHTYFHVRRNGTDYYALGVAGGGSAMNGQEPTKDAQLMGPEYGEMDHIAWVTVPKNGKPVIANIMLDGVFPADYLDQATTKSTYLTYALDDPPIPAATARMERNASAAAAALYRWDGATFDRWANPNGGAPSSAWSISEREIRFDASAGPAEIVCTTPYDAADLHFQQLLPPGAHAQVVFEDADTGKPSIVYDISGDLCCGRWRHGRIAVSGRDVKLEVDGVCSQRLVRDYKGSLGHFKIRALSGKGAFRGFYTYDLTRRLR